ncbi:hypothetical protein [Acetobacter vaccinii]|uniref:hypothetical protein n=1 Tax=Acetobacter vaccinii TaxID=2592655 RepID=UPI00143D59F8|nr:hypothetical protein [Acetobacter vaccinii]
MHSLSFILVAAALGLGLATLEQIPDQMSATNPGATAARTMPISMPSLLPH